MGIRSAIADQPISIASYTSIVPPLASTGQPFALVVASSRLARVDDRVAGERGGAAVAHRAAAVDDLRRAERVAAVDHGRAERSEPVDPRLHHRFLRPRASRPCRRPGTPARTSPCRDSCSPRCFGYGQIRLTVESARKAGYARPLHARRAAHPRRPQFAGPARDPGAHLGPGAPGRRDRGRLQRQGAHRLPAPHGAPRGRPREPHRRGQLPPLPRPPRRAAQPARSARGQLRRGGRRPTTCRRAPWPTWKRNRS